ncbi:MAG: redox-sensing transcriptional repressor Rex [Planctomycetota bacterium]|jgi:redox-sensing transcriptional repressor|nr:redox-sensing transcriptional repressor Rex [Planctomycetota bacterium]
MRVASRHPFPHPSIRRLPLYLRFLKQLRDAGSQKISCTRIARELDLDSTQVRKDLALTGIVGRPRIGYVLTDLVQAIEKFLGWDQRALAFLAGVGNLGRAIIGYEDFRRCGLDIVAAFDIDAGKIGGEVFGRRVYHPAEMPALTPKLGVSVGVITVPAVAAQEVADVMVKSGISGIWNFSPIRLELPPRVRVENALLTSSLAVLSVDLKRESPEAAPPFQRPPARRSR